MPTQPSPRKNVFSSLFLALLFVSTPLFTQAQLLDWMATSTYSTNSNFPSDITQDNSGNSYLCGGFKDTLVLGADTLTAFMPFNRLYLAKLDTNGTPLWAIQSEGNYSWQFANEVLVDGSGDIFLLGSFTDTLNIQGLTATTTQLEYKFFIAKFDSNGNIQWLQSATGPGECTSQYMLMDQTGNIYVAGSYDSTAQIGSFVLPQALHQDLFMAKFSPSGNALWAKTFLGAQNNYWEGLEFNSSNNLVLAGSYSDSIILDTTALYLPGWTHYFLCEFDNSGNIQWAKTIASNSWIGGIRTMAVNSLDEIVVAGSVQDTFFVDTIQLFTDPANSFDVLVAKFDANGNVIWVDLGEGPNPDRIVDISFDSIGDIYATGNFSGHMQLGSLSMSTVQFSNSEAFYLKLSPSGVPLFALQSGTGTQSNGSDIKVTSQGEVYLLGSYKTSFSMGGQTVTSTSTDFQTVVGKLRTSGSNQILGHVFRDINNNTIQDIGDDDLSGIIVQAQPGNYYAVTSSNGDYTIHSDTGNFEVKVPNPPIYHTNTPDTYQVHFNTLSLIDSHNVFAAYPTPGIKDAVITATPVTQARIGSSTYYDFTYENVGSSLIDSGEVQFEMDSNLIFVHSNTPYTQSGQTITWKYYNLDPWTSHQIRMEALLDSTTTLGTILFSHVSITPTDTTPANNADSLWQTAVLSYDPNNKTVSDDTLTPLQIANEPWLHYTIRFQNTGTDTAYDVVIRDTLSTMLNLTTLEVLSSSDSYELKLGKSRDAVFEFIGIYLPDSNINEPESHGFIKYRIKPNTNLQLGDEIHNNASIYFDFNAPIVTNTAITRIDTFELPDTIDFILPIKDQKLDVQLYPNPNNGIFNISINSPQNDNLTLYLFDHLGALAQRQQVTISKGKQNIPVSFANVSNGLYFIVLQSSDGASTSKRVIIEK